MRIRSRLRLVVLVLLALFCLTDHALLASNDIETKTGRQYSEATERTIWDFTNVAFSSSIWLENSSDATSVLAPIKAYSVEDRHKRKTSETWVSEYIHRPKGLPAHDRIVKWNKPVGVGIGWPIFGTGNSDDWKPSSSVLDLAEDQIKKLLPDLRTATGLPIEFIPSTDSREKTKEFARVRIVFIPTTNLWNHFKVLNVFPNSTVENWHYQLNSRYVGAIPFTASSKAQVDGFLLPNADNTLGLAVCRILSTLPQNIMRTLISECLVRSMGLPELSRLSTKALVGPWNSAYDRTEKLPATDADAIVWPGMRDKTLAAEKFYATLPPAEGSVEHSGALTEYDKTLLSLLYCAAIKSGSDKYGVMAALVSHPNCFSNNKNN